MNRSYLHHVLSIVATLFAMTACVFPGQAPQPQAIQPTPGIDVNAVATAVAATAQAAATQTASSQLFGTSIPAMTGTTLEQLPDGTTQYSDYDAGFEITFPAGWLAVRPNSEEFEAALANEAASNSMLHDQMTSDLAGYEANLDRVYAYILRPDIEKDTILGFSELEWDANDAVPIDSTIMGELVKGLESPEGIPGFRADVVQLHEDSPVRMIEIGGRWTVSDEQGGTIPFYATFIFFKPTPNSTVRLLFTFLDEHHTQISADVKFIIESIRVIEASQ